MPSFFIFPWRLVLFNPRREAPPSGPPNASRLAEDLQDVLAFGIFECKRL
jgi:hypothetical protein